jgi:hypothetical protein
MKRVQLALFLAAALTAGCRDQGMLQPPATGAPLALIRDGAHEGNPFFFFLPPLVPNATSFFHSGKFNARLAPVVEVCELTGDPRTLSPVAECTATIVFGPARMTLDGSSEQYQLNWDTKASQLSAIKFYRIIVRGAARGQPLGFVDVDPVDQGMKNVRTGDVVAFQDGRTLPIKVRIEDGAFGSTNSNDHVEQVVPSRIATGTLDVTTNTGFAGARFPDDWLPNGIDQVVVIIERLQVNNDDDRTNCLRSGLEEREGCYRFRTDPDLHGLGSDGQDLIFKHKVIAGVCFENPAEVGHPGAPPYQLHRREEVDGVLTGGATPLEDVDAPFLRCAGFGRSSSSIGAAVREGRVGDVARAGWDALVRGIGRLVSPSPLYGIDAGAGGSTDEFSRFGYARHATIAVTEGNGATAVAGSIITASVHVESSHHEEEDVPVVNQPVTFTVRGTTGSLVGEPDVMTRTVPTNTDGNASVSWRLGAGTNTIDVSTNHVTNSPVVITATGQPPATGVLAFVQQPTDQIASLRTLVVAVQALDQAGAALPAVQVTLRDGPRNAALGCGMGSTQLNAVTDATGRATFTLVDVSGACDTATLAATGAKVGFTPMSAESRPFAIADIGGLGTATIDGQFDPSWAAARCLQFAASVPEGGTIPAMLCAMNDEVNAYFLVRFSRAPDPQSSVDFQFDQNRSGTINSGDDLIIFRNPSFTFEDDHWFDNAVDPACSVGSICSRGDAAAGGASNGQGAFGNNGGETVIEISHPLRSGDNHDISVASGQTLDFFLGLNIYDQATRSTFSRTSFRPGLLKLLLK